MENRSGPLIGAVVSHADGFAERVNALLDCVPGTHAKTVGADKTYDTHDSVSDCRARNVTPHVAHNDARPGGSAIDDRTSRRAGHQMSRVIRNVSRSISAGARRSAVSGRPCIVVSSGSAQHFKLTMVASNVTRMARRMDAVSAGVVQMSLWDARRVAHGAGALTAQTDQLIRKSAESRMRNTPEHCFGLRDEALFNNLLDANCGGILLS